ncbi:MAG TPA: CPBP family intramembrane metalloprotease [Candidatus Bathyarchaeota archaeon]|nr:CPBP family intramembrane metalloprotease [Candidatus Bathyarchaeota archaeon]
MNVSSFSWKQWTVIAAPVVLVLSMILAFQGFTVLLGSSLGYFSGFLLYWIGWCLVLPIIILKPRGILELFRESEKPFGTRPWLTAFITFWPIILPLSTYFLPNILKASAEVIILSIVIGVIIGVTEEILWRGVYIKVFPENIWLRYIYPSIGFALWHIAPQSVRPSAVPGGAIAFVLVSLFLGLSWGYYAHKTDSIRWCTVAHVINDSFGLAGFAWLTILTSL